MPVDDNIRLLTKDLKALSQTSVYLKNGEEAIALLSVFHSLHCLVRIL